MIGLAENSVHPVAWDRSRLAPKLMIVEHFPRKVTEIENSWIPLPDGIRLASRIWMPEDAWKDPVPAILEYIPYGKRGGTRWRDEPMHRYFAGHGYAAVRVDLRGTGESDGVLEDEYTEQELQDGLAVIRWIASQPWCNGAVGMMGKSWGAFNSLQIAALRPQELKAVIAVCSTDDRYSDDAHYMGGCLLSENMIWGAMMLTLSIQPPDPELVGPEWRDLWFQRLQNCRPYTEIWLRHQLRDDYWKHGSVCEDYSRIQVPVYAIGGWADAYSNSIPRLLSSLEVPRKGLVGPWAHVYPHRGIPGPGIGFLQEALRWWDHWLKDRDTGILQEPVYRVWMQDSVPPSTFHEFRPGRWVAENSRREVRAYCVAEGRLQASPVSTSQSVEGIRLSSPQTTGLGGGRWCSFGMRDDMPGDQREDDAGSLVFDSEPLREAIEILGAPVVELSIASDRPRALVAVRLSDVAPDGSVSRVTYGVLNLTHRNGHDRSLPIEPGAAVGLRIQMNQIGHRFLRGHRIRLAISTAYWPVVWPSPEAVTLTVFPALTLLELPARIPGHMDSQLRDFQSPECAPLLDPADFEPGEMETSLETDQDTGITTLVQTSGFDEDGTPFLSELKEIRLTTGHSTKETFRIHKGDPLSARIEIQHHTVTSRGNWSVQVKTFQRFSATREEFLLESTVEALEDSSTVFERKWSHPISRNGV